MAKSEGCVSGFFIVLLILGGLYWLLFTDKTDYSKPWFEGNKYEQVCEAGIDDEDNCYVLLVNEFDGNIFRINFPNEGYKLGSSTCYKASEYSTVKRYCTFNPSDSNVGIYEIKPIESEWTK